MGLAHPVSSKVLTRDGSTHFKIGAASMQGFRTGTHEVKLRNSKQSRYLLISSFATPTLSGNFFTNHPIKHFLFSNWLQHAALFLNPRLLASIGISPVYSPFLLLTIPFGLCQTITYYPHSRNQPQKWRMRTPSTQKWPNILPRPFSESLTATMATSVLTGALNIFGASSTN